MRGLAVFFPGIGYTADKPLLYYSRRLAAEQGYEVRPLSYGGFPYGVLGDADKMAECCRSALAQAGETLAETDLAAYDDILFVGKSIGTIVAARLAAASPAAAKIRLVLYTPLEETFACPLGEAVAFTGEDDPWVGGSASRIPELCRERGIPCHVIPKANHSLESGDCRRDVQALARILERTGRFIASAALRGTSPHSPGLT